MRELQSALWKARVRIAALGCFLLAGAAMATVTPSPVAIPAQIETAPFSGAVATFTTTDPSPVASNYSATIYWGDGAQSVGTITGPVAGVFTVNGTHTFPEDGTFSVFVLIHDSVDNTNASVVSTAAVQEGSFVLNGVAPLTGVVGKAFVGVLATFQDPGSTDGPSAFTATIDWGDSTTGPGTISGAGGNFTVLGTHTYSAVLTGSVNVTVAEPSAGFSIGPNPDSVTITAGTVAPPAVTVIPLTFTATETIAFNGAVATFTTTDPSPVATNYTGTINWGDGTQSAAVVAGPTGGAFSVSGTHTYAEDGTYSVFVTVHDSLDSSDAAATSTANVGEGSFVLSGVTPITIPEGTFFNGVVATITDPNTTDLANAFSATIDWGDGQVTTGIITGPAGGPFNVIGMHTYADEMSGSINVTVSEPSANFTLGPNPDSITVTEADVLNGNTTLSTAVAGAPVSGQVASFSDAYTGNVASDFTATINWGDGSPVTAGTVTGGGATYGVSGSHTYAAGGSFTLSVTLTDDAPGTATATASGTVQVATQADLAVTKTGPEGAPIPGGTLTYTVDLTNNGPSAAQSVVLSDAVPANTTFVSETQNSGPAFNCTTPAAGGTGTVSCTLATLAAGTSANFTIVLKINPGYGGFTVTNTATVSSATNDAEPTNNSSSVSTAVAEAIPTLGPAMLLALALLLAGFAALALQRRS